MSAVTQWPRDEIDVEAVLRQFGELEAVDMAFAASVPGNGTFVLDRFHGARTDALRGVTVPSGRA